MTTPLVCVFVAFLLIYLPRIIVAAAQGKQPEGFDNKHPRDQQARLTGWGRRANAAHMNAFEAFAPFAAAVLVAHVTHADAKWSAILAIAHVAARVAYVGLYVGNVDRARSGVWMVGLAATIGLFVLPMVGR